MSTLVDCSDLFVRKQRWTPSGAVSQPVTSGAEQTLGRCTALRLLEIPVGNFIQEATRRDLPVSPETMELLVDNIRDEDVHDQALQTLSDSWNLTSEQDTETARQFLATALELEDHPVSIARVLEVSIFFVILPIFRYLGNASSRAISADISRDERVHVETNTRICQALGIQPSRQLKRLRREVVAWMTEGLDCGDALPEGKKQYGSSDFWLRQSDKLLEEGRAPELRETRRSTVMAFFESPKVIQPLYAAAKR
jgi:hypothetical protein